MASSSTSATRSLADSRLYLIYFLLAGFDLLAVSFSLILIDQITTKYDNSVTVNQEWADRLADYDELNHLAVEANTPGNDAFNTDLADLAEQEQSLDAAVIAFEEKRQKIHEDLKAIHEEHGDLLETFGGIDDYFEGIRNEARQIFTLLREDERERAGQHMAAMDHNYAGMTGVLNILSKTVRGIQKDLLEGQNKAAKDLRKFEFLIGVFIFLMVIAVTLYGHRLSGQMKAAAAEQERTLETLADSEAKVRGIFESARDGILSVLEDGQVTSANRAAAEMFGYTIDVLCEQHLDMLFGFPEMKSGTQPPPATQRLRSLEEQGLSHEVDGVRQNGEIFAAEFVVSRVHLHDRSFWTVSVRDITDRKRAEAELARHREHLESLVKERTASLEASHDRLRIAERMASIGTLAAGLGHDMNNVLFPVLCRLDALKTEELPEHVHDAHTDMRKSLDFLQQLSDGLRLLAVDPEDSNAASGITHLDKWWGETRRLFATALPEETKLEQDLPSEGVHIAVAPHRLTQAVFNLVVNAGEAVGADGIVRIITEVFPEKEEVHLTVSDNGCGMSDEVRSRALDPFFTSKTRSLSTGLGLTLVHGVAQEAGGSIEIDSTPGLGTAIVLKLPLAAVEGGGPMFLNEEERTASISIPDRRVATFVSSFLQALGFEIEYLETGASPRGHLWVTDSALDKVDLARTFLDSGGRKRIIVVGNGAPEWSELGVVTVDVAEGMDALRAAIHRVTQPPQEARK